VATYAQKACSGIPQKSMANDHRISFEFTSALGAAGLALKTKCHGN
jgi:hypothetical protein